MRIPPVKGDKSPKVSKLLKPLKDDPVAYAKEEDRLYVLEQKALQSVRSYAAGESPLEKAMKALITYEEEFGEGKKHFELFEETLRDRPLAGGLWRESSVRARAFVTWQFPFWCRQVLMLSIILTPPWVYASWQTNKQVSTIEGRWLKSSFEDDFIHAMDDFIHGMDDGRMMGEIVLQE